jgi:hypothetical protein
VTDPSLPVGLIVRAARPEEFAALGELTVAAYRTLPGRDHAAARGYEPSCAMWPVEGIDLLGYSLELA